MEDPARQNARALAAAHTASGDPTGWFDVLYRQANGEFNQIPWADRKPNAHLVDWLTRHPLPPGKALVVGCGLGDDAEYLATLGFSVDAFDISAEAIRWAKSRFPASKVRYQTVDLFAAQPHWRRAFDLVVEIYTLQALPESLRQKAIPLLADCVAPTGLLFVTCRARNETDDRGSMPWPLTESELRQFENVGLSRQSFEDFPDTNQVRRFRAVFNRHA